MDKTVFTQPMEWTRPRWAKEREANNSKYFTRKINIITPLEYQIVIDGRFFQYTTY